MLNLIWSGFFIIGIGIAFYQAFTGNIQIWQDMTNSLFDSADSGFKIALNLTGILCFWLGLLKIAEKSGLTNCLAKILKPLFFKIMPDISRNSPAFGSITMNIAANILGLDNAATPMGLKAMEELQKENSKKDSASPAQILFMVINSSSVTLVPFTILMYRYQFGSVNPSLVFIPILLATSISTLVGFTATALWQKINIFSPVILAYLGFGVLSVIGITFGFIGMDYQTRLTLISSVSNGLLIGIIALFIFSGLVRRQNVYENFIIGAKEGFTIAVQIIPYLVAMLTAIAVFRASGAMNYVCDFIEKIFAYFNFNTDFVTALPTALMKPLSGSGARAMMIDTFNIYGVDSFAGFTSSVVQGSTETTFYVLAVYFGAVKISKTGPALPLALLADLSGIIAAISFSYVFYQG
ncbi:MAG: hypothetical protein MJ210_02040 [Alphaproteobacteria bacterium]|nr:hypothetical protein [Alphaproteobacteria bacterium]